MKRDGSSTGFYFLLLTSYFRLCSTSAVMVIVRLGASSPKVTDDYRGFRKGVYVRVTEGNSELETGLPIRALFFSCSYHHTRVETGPAPSK